jgi:hypothetical protein
MAMEVGRRMTRASYPNALPAKTTNTKNIFAFKAGKRVKDPSLRPLWGLSNILIKARNEELSYDI